MRWLIHTLTNLIFFLSMGLASENMVIWDLQTIYKSRFFHPESLTLKIIMLIFSLTCHDMKRQKSSEFCSSADPGYEDALSNLSRLNFLESSQSGSTSSSNSAHSSSFDQYDPLAAFSVDEVRALFRTNYQPLAKILLELQGSLPVQSLKLEQHERIKLIRTNIS